MNPAKKIDPQGSHFDISFLSVQFTNGLLPLQYKPVVKRYDVNGTYLYSGVAFEVFHVLAEILNFRSVIMVVFLCKDSLHLRRDHATVIL